MLSFHIFFSLLYTSCYFAQDANIVSNEILIPSVDENDDFAGNFVEQRFPNTQEYPSFVIRPQTALVDTGETIVIDCVATGNPLPEITWQRNIIGFINTLPNNSLIIQNASMEDSGRYSCIADNGLGQIYTQFNVLVKVHGGLSSWSSWSDCSVDCGKGNEFRYRYCNNPPPRNGGNNCNSTLKEGRRCEGERCNVDGGFGEWSEWIDCSKKCGGGRTYRFRACNSPMPLGNGKPCNPEESIESKFCNLQQCGVPHDVREVLGMLRGKVNGIEFFDAGLMVNLDNVYGKLYINAILENLLPELTSSLQTVPVIYAPIYWGVMKVNDSVNGFMVSGGTFEFNSQVQFSTGEQLQIFAIVDYIDGSNVPLFEMKLSGSLPTVGSNVVVTVADYSEQVISTRNDRNYGQAFHIITIDDVEIDSYINYTIKYSAYERTRPPVHIYDVQKFQTSTGDNKLRASSVVGITESHDCPVGFKPNGFFCQDENECMQNACSQICINTFGSYLCQCKSGYEISSNDLDCEDLNECEIGLHSCGIDEICINNNGSYSCVSSKCIAGYVRNNITGLCDDINECLGAEICKTGQLCKNTVGSFECFYPDCGLGYFRNETSGRCDDYDECLNGVYCGLEQKCVNLPGSYVCEYLPCDIGYERNSTGQCADINECTTRRANCSPEEMCKNLPGSYKCDLLPCLLGFQRNSEKKCEDIDECKLDPSPCGIMEDCENEIGSFYCYPMCEQGFTLNKFLAICEDINECLNENVCPNNTICFNAPGVYSCLPGIKEESSKLIVKPTLTIKSAISAIKVTSSPVNFQSSSLRKVEQTLTATSKLTTATSFSTKGNTIGLVPVSRYTHESIHMTKFIQPTSIYISLNTKSEPSTVSGTQRTTEEATKVTADFETTSEPFRTTTISRDTTQPTTEETTKVISQLETTSEPLQTTTVSRDTKTPTTEETTKETAALETTSEPPQTTSVSRDTKNPPQKKQLK